MTANNKTARIAGLIYLGLIIVGIFSILYVPSQLLEWDNPAQTIANIKSNIPLFLSGIAGSILCYLLYIFLSLAFYNLLESVNKDIAKVMVILVLVSIPISFLNLSNNFAVFSLLTEDYSQLMSANEVQSQVMLHLDLKGYGVLIAQIFWGLWLLPLGYLVYNSGFLPKIIGVFLMIGCFSYMTDTIGYLFFDGYSQTFLSNITGIPSALGEFSICLWLLIFGAKSKIQFRKSIA